MNRPWLITLGPLVPPDDARRELRALAHGLTPDEYSSKVWGYRMEQAPTIKRSRSRSWPKTCREPKGAFVLPGSMSNVLSIRRKSHDA